MSFELGEQIKDLIQGLLHGRVGPDTISRALNGSSISALDLSPAQKSAISEMIEPILAHPDCWTRAWDVSLLLASIQQHYADKVRGAHHLIHAFTTCTDRQKRTQLLFQLRVLDFSQNLGLASEIRDLYFQHYNDWFGHLPPPPPYPVNPKRAIILASQILDPPHAPTVDSIAKYRILQDTFGYDVAIINSCEVPEKNPLMLADNRFGYRKSELHGFQHISPGPIKIFTPTTAMPSEEGYRQICAFVAAWQPAFILNYGAFNFSGEYLGLNSLVITMPAGIELLPTKTSRFAVSFRPLTDEDHQMIARCGMDNVQIIETRYNYDRPTPFSHYQRSAFDLREDDVVLTVVSNRIADEIDADNINLMTRILALDSHIRLVFLGRSKDDTVAMLKNSLPEDRIRVTGFIDDMPAFYEQIADLYINPHRIGGGTSAAHALAFGIPAFTLAFGHVASLTHPDFIFDSEDAMLAAIQTAIRPEMRATFRQKALEGFDLIGSRERMLRSILTQAGLPGVVRDQPSPLLHCI